VLLHIILFLFAKVSLAIQANWTVVWLYEIGWEQNYLPNYILRDIYVGETIEMGRNFSDRGLPAIQHLIKEETIFILRQGVSDRKKQGKRKILNAELADTIHEMKLKRVVGVLLGDESCLFHDRCTADDNTTSRFIHGFPLIVRNYYTWDCARTSNVMFAPLGTIHVAPHTHILTNSSTVWERPYVWSFSSRNPTWYRDELIARMLKGNSSLLQPYLLRYPRFTLQPEAYMTLLNDSVFCVAPEGGVPETWRLYEILESGCIPVVHELTFTRHYKFVLPCNLTNDFVMTKNPVEEIERWMTKPRDELEKRRKRLITTYNIWREDWIRNITQRINSLGEANIENERTRTIQSSQGGRKPYWLYVVSPVSPACEPTTLTEY